MKSLLTDDAYEISSIKLTGYVKSCLLSGNYHEMSSLIFLKNGRRKKKKKKNEKKKRISSAAVLNGILKVYIISHVPLTFYIMLISIFWPVSSVT